MLAQCFYLIAFITTFITVTVSNVTLFPDGVKLMFGSHSVVLLNAKPSSVKVGMSRINSTSTGFSVLFVDPLEATMVSNAVVNGTLFLSNVTIDASVSGSLEMTKEVYDTCRTNTTAMTYCDTKMSVEARGSLDGSLTTGNQDVCDRAENIVTQLLAPKP